jgi:TRAP transporter TAXI family solute receptor
MRSHKHEGRLRAPVAAAILVLAMAAMSAAVAQQKTTVVLGTATQGGGFQIYGAAYSAALNESDPTLVVEQRSTKGSTENAPLLAEGKIDIGLLTGEVTYEVLTGIGRPPANLKIINAMYPNSGMFMVRGDSPYRSISDLKGKPIAWGASGSGFVVLARYVFDALGMDIDKDFSPIYSASAGDGPKMVLDGRAAAQWGGGVGWPGFVAIANGPSGARFITPTPEELKRVLTKYPFIKPITLPAGSYVGQSGPVAALGSWSLVLARPGLPEEAAYKLARALHKAQGALGAKLEQAKESTLANTLAAAPRQDLIHPGVLRYMREAGILK